MPQLRVGLAQINTTVGDLTANAAAVLHWATIARDAGVHLLTFPEMTLTGYPPEDLVLRQGFLAASERAVAALAHALEQGGCGDVAVVVGHAAAPQGGERADRGPGTNLGRNAASVLHGGRAVACYSKHHLPNYGVFDESRYFTRGRDFPVVRLHGVDIAMTICEDLWQDGGPIALARDTGVGLVVCINGSPYERGKLRYREDLIARRAREAGAPIAYVNLVGAQDELVFDGASMVFDGRGALLARAPQFEQGLMAIDLDLAAPPDRPEVSSGRTETADPGDDVAMQVERITLSAEPLPRWDPIVAGRAELLNDCDEVWAAVVLATRDYVEKNGFSTVVLGLSGGIDSAVTATIAVDALGADRVFTVALPSAYSSQHSLDDAADLAERQGTQHSVVAIKDVVEAYGGLIETTGLAEENLQARVRGTTLMGLSNQHGHLVLTTGNKSELATGFSTLYGDSAGGFGPIKDVPKSLVWELARRRNQVAEERGERAPIPPASIEKPPSAELAPGQLDADRLPDYPTLDAVLEDYIVAGLSVEELSSRHDPDVVRRIVRLVDLAEYKRRQYPPGPKITPRAFGRDRRLPITSHWREGS